MFGIFYTLLCLFGYGKSSIRDGMRDAESESKAIESGRSTFIDTRGRSRLVLTGEVVCYQEDQFTGDYGYIIIDKRSKNRREFVNLSEQERVDEWNRAHSEYLRGEPHYNKYGYIVDVIPWFRKRGSQDDQHYTLVDPRTRRIYYNPGRACQGERYRDIATGKMMVIRTFSMTDPWFKQCINKKHEFYIDIETGKIIRETHRDNSENHRELNERVDAFIDQYNAEQESKLKAGIRKSDPKDFYKNDYTFSNHLFFTERWVR